MTVSEAAKKWRLPQEMVHSWLVRGKIPGAKANYVPDYIVNQGRPFPTGHFGAKFHNAHQDAEDQMVIAPEWKEAPMRLTITHKSGIVEVVESAHSATLSYRIGGTPDTFDQGQLTALHLDSIESLEVSDHAEAPKPEIPLPTKQVEMSAAEFFMGPVNMKYATDKAQEEKVILTMRKPTKGTT